jgi:murein DD-endopeptidase MepM/ murein hydrolase activator NlpD
MQSSTNSPRETETRTGFAAYRARATKLAATAGNRAVKIAGTAGDRAVKIAGTANSYMKTRRGQFTVAAAALAATGVVAAAATMGATPSGAAAAGVSGPLSADRVAAAQRADRHDRPTTAPAAAPAAKPVAPKAAPKPVAKKAAPKPVVKKPAVKAAPKKVVHKAKPAPAWVLPMRSFELTSCYGYRTDPYPQFHQGIDFANVPGTPNRAAHAGTVIMAGDNGDGYGRKVVISHGNNTYTLYGHGERVLVHVGQHVVAGQPVSLEGATGDVTGPHLHFEVWKGLWNRVNPGNYLRAHGVHLNGC